MTDNFRRSEHQFFHQPSTRECLQVLASAKSLVIYCGAGVSIDRTGMGWGQLLTSVFSPDPSSHDSYPTVAELEMLREHEDPVRLASVVVQYGLSQFASAEALKNHIVPLLQNRLYKANAWQAGRLMRTICRLAIFSALLGKNVHIVTTNYDTYLEHAYQDETRRIRKVISADKLPIPTTSALDNLPQLVVQVLKDDLTDERTINPPTSSVASVYLHYLHGRVHQEGSGDGPIILSEHDYAMSRSATIATLKRLLGSEPALILIGASLADPPLVDALALTRRSMTSTADRVPLRFALMPRATFSVYEDSGRQMSSRLIQHLGMRCEHMDVRLIVPDFRFQTAQFLEELVYCSMLGDPQNYLQESERRRYGLRLVDWWEAWTQRTVATDPYQMHRQLHNGYEVLSRLIQALAPHQYGTNLPKENFRLELWVREDPATHRCLTLWAHTGGPILDRQTLKRAQLETISTNASVRAFNEGRPQHIDSSELDAENRANPQWRSYLSIPIYVPLREDIGTPVGSITLASTSSRAESIFPLLRLSDMHTVKAQMISAGRSLLGSLESPQ
ncbi:MAG: SIR2 family protein [Candidatus Saccharimonadales bacterium]